MQDLNLTLVQSALDWQAPQQNRERFEQVFASLMNNKQPTDIIVLPEMFTSGFTMSPQAIAEPVNGETTQWMQQHAKQLNAAICGSVVTQVGEGDYRNRFLFVTPDGGIEYYDKRHLFRMAKEHEHYTAGNVRKVVEYKGWRLLLQVCYDLRFPVFSRNRNDYDLMLYVANWPAPRVQAWRTLLQARAIENQSYVVGVNRVGSDASGLDYTGDSLLVDYMGKVLVDGEQGEVFTKQHVIQAAPLIELREKVPAWLDADEFAIR